MNERYLTVGALTKYMKRKLETDSHLQNVWLKGEISNFKRHSRGHLYMTIKDDEARIQAVMFQANTRSLRFEPENGMQVLLRGDIGLYEPHGLYQLYIQRMEPDGMGSLFVAFEQLKKNLQQEGLFDPSFKKKIPIIPQHIGIITSPTGAAIRDILTTIKRRFPLVKITVLPVSVQGELAPRSITRALGWANQKNIFDLLILGRGGGSIEELWAFNDESVARAVFESKIPVISAVGHETDTTITDFVADLRAPTPTAAAELAVPSRKELLEKLHSITQQLNKFLNYTVDGHRKKLDSLNQSYAFRYPQQLIVQKEQELDRLQDVLDKNIRRLYDTKKEEVFQLTHRLHQNHPRKQIQWMESQLTQLNKDLQRTMERRLEQKQELFHRKINQLSLLNPLSIMQRGYSITKKNEEIIKSIRQVQPGDPIKVQLSDGLLDCQVWGMVDKGEEES
ncbi:exodeoxyribonuclease VII large subunit [Bacillaceae bacterium S4-13-56]